ncbi:MAG TPA: protein kinase, partial [Acidimicrobiales bacterium]|nr:protein kinase [Acidimicrobiales bacterium]
MARLLSGGYEVHDVIGRGALGQVWRGTAPADGRPVAVKLLRPDLAADDEVLARFTRERAALQGLDHPNLVRVRDVVVDGGELALVTDLVPGSDLRRVLAESPGGTLEPGLALDLVGQVLAGLDALHAAGVVHRDVKPSNVLVDRTGPGPPHAQLTDFRVAGLAGGPALTRRTAPLGTPDYLAPEVIDGAGGGPPADVYATGTLLYELLFGRTPFGGGSHLSVLQRHRKDQPERPPGVPDGLWAVLSDLLAKDPARRPTAGNARRAVLGAAREVAGRPPFPALVRPGEADGTRLHRAQAGRAPADESVAARPRPRPRRRQRLAVAVLGLAVVVGLVAAGLVLLPGETERAPSGGRYAFAPVRLDTGVVVARVWSLDDGGGRFRGVVTATNDGTTAVPVELDEVLPASLADHVDRVAFSPPPDEVVDPALAVRWRLGPLAPAETAEVAYEVAVRPQDDGVERLRAWADERDRLLGPATGAPLVELSIGPPAVQLATGQRFPLRARGSMADATPAPPAVLAGLAWSSTDSGVATVEHGTLRAVAPGRTTVQAQAGRLVSRVAVAVGDPPAGTSAPPAPAGATTAAPPGAGPAGP